MASCVPCICVCRLRLSIGGCAVSRAICKYMIIVFFRVWRSVTEAHPCEKNRRSNSVGGSYWTTKSRFKYKQLLHCRHFRYPASIDLLFVHVDDVNISSFAITSASDPIRRSQCGGDRTLNRIPFRNHTSCNLVNRAYVSDRDLITDVQLLPYLHCT